MLNILQTVSTKDVQDLMLDFLSTATIRSTPGSGKFESRDTTTTTILISDTIFLTIITTSARWETGNWPRMSHIRVFSLQLSYLARVHQWSRNLIRSLSSRMGICAQPSSDCRAC